MCIDYEYLIWRISLFFLSCDISHLAFYPAGSKYSLFISHCGVHQWKNIVTICNLPVNNLTAGLPVSEKSQLLPAMKISFMGLPGGKDTFQLEFSQHKAFSVSKSCSRAVWEKITQQVCGDAVKTSRKCRKFSPVWELDAKDWQSQNQGEHPQGCFEMAGKLRQAWGWGMSSKSSIPASLGIGDAAWPSWVFPRSILCIPDLVPAGTSGVATATAGTCQHLSP